MNKLRALPWLKWLKHLFIALHSLLFSSLLLSSSALYIAFRPDGLQLLNTYLLKPMGVRYSHADGSLLDGFTLYDLRSEHLKAKKLSLIYQLDSIMDGKHIIDRIAIDGLRIHLDDFLEDSSSPWPFPTFAIREVSLTNLQLISDYPIELDLYAKNGSYDGENLSFSILRTSFKSTYASGAIQGRMHNNSLSGRAVLYPNLHALSSTSGRFTDLPEKLFLTIDKLSDSQAKIRTRLDTLILHQDDKLQASEIALAMDYDYEHEYLDFAASYLLKRDGNQAKIHQTLRYSFDHETQTRLDGTVLESTYPLPTNIFHAEFIDNPKGLQGAVDADGTHFTLSSTDYDHFDWRIKSHHNDLTFITLLPNALRSSIIDLSAEGSYLLSSNDLKGSLRCSHTEGDFDGRFSSYEGIHQLDGIVRFKPGGMVMKQTTIPLPEQIHLSLFLESGDITLNLTGEETAFSLSSGNGHLQGFGNYHGTTFTLTGLTQDDKTSVDIKTHTPSLLKTLSALHPIKLDKGEWFDAEMDTVTHLSYNGEVHASGTLSLPWYALTLDSQRAYGGTGNTLSYRYDNGNIQINHYSVDVTNHIFTSPKQANIRLTKENQLIIDEFWIYDSLQLKGSIFLNDLSAQLHLHSDRFTYEGPEGKAHAGADISLTRDAEANHAITGDILIQDALITYLPLQQFKVMDDDIIIVQDVRPPSDTHIRMNLHVSAKQPIHFKTKELDLTLDPDLTFWKDPQGPIQILGLVTIPSGEIKTSGKKFDIASSHIYFGGEVPLNPYLDFTVSHEVDYKKLYIYVTHRLDSPIFLFASDPVMSQNDIMSYLLFGSPANVSLNSDRSTTTARADATNFMLGAGLKELIGGATKIQLDTMNILTTEKGGMGFEVGTYINKDLRVLYKNNTVSSILVQYRLNRWLRLDADVHELGQGINAIYVQDFRDFLPHHELKKK